MLLYTNMSHKSKPQKVFQFFIKQHYRNEKRSDSISLNNAF